MAIQGKRTARIELRADSSGLDSGLREARKKLGAFGAMAKKISGGAMGALGKLGGGILQGVGFGALGGVGDIVGDIMDVERSMTRFQIATSKTPEQMEAFRDAMAKTTKESGISRSELMAGAAQYVALTGDADGATAAMDTFAMVSNATGASMEDIAATAAAMKDNLKIDPKDFKAAFSALAVQGKFGAVELKELAGVMADIAPQFADFAGGEGAGGLAEMGAALQVVKKGFGTSEKAATGLRSLMTSLGRNADKFKKAGVDMFNFDKKSGKKTLKNFSEIITAIGNSKLANDPTLLIDAFGSDEAARSYAQLSKNKALYDDLIKQGKESNAIEKDAAAYRNSTAGKMDLAMAALKQSIVEVFTPERIAAFVEALSKAVQVAVTLVETLDALPGFIKHTKAGDIRKVATDQGTVIARDHNRIRAGSEARKAAKLKADQLSADGSLSEDDLVQVREAARGAAVASKVDPKFKGISMAEQIGHSKAGSRISEEEKAAIGDSVSSQVIASMKNMVWQGPVQQVQASPVTVKIDAEPVATAVSQSRNARTSVGGR